MLPLRLLLLLILIDRCWSLYEIDWSQCITGSSRLCYVDVNCIPSVENASRTFAFMSNANFLINKHPQDPNRKTCNIGIQTRKYSDSKLLVILQVIGQGTLSYRSNALGLYQGEELLAGCKGTNGEVELIGQDNKRSLALYKDATHFNDNHLVCAFTIYRPAEFKKTLSSGFSRDLLTSLRYSNKSSYEDTKLPFWINGYYVFQLTASVSCDPDEIIMQRFIEDHHVIPIKDINRDVIDCSNQESSLGYKLMYTDVNATTTEISSLSCQKQKKTSEFAWHIIFNGNTAPLAIDDPQQFAFACATNIAKMCENPLKCSGSDCPVFNNGTESNDAKISCPGGKWIIEGEYYKDIQPQCKAEMTKMNTANFYINLGESEVDFTGGRCFENYDCNLKSRLDYSNCDEKDEECALLKRDNTTITCQKERKVVVQVRQANKTISASKFNCEKSTGQWKDEKGEAIPEFSLVMCEAVAKKEKEVKSYEVELAVVIAGTILLMILISVGCVWRQRRKVYGRKKRAISQYLSPAVWEGMKPEKRAKIAKNIFEIICAGEIGGGKIEQGLQVIDLMLDTEMEIPEAWESAQQFLWRLRSTAHNYDQALYEKIGRYLYLRAKKIIDKYGWISATPVTKDNLNGYIITVAVQLLGNAMYSSSTNDDAENLIVEGFRKLRYAGESAYPQCGVLWSLITQIVIGEKTKEGQIRRQNFIKMNEEFLQNIVNREDNLFMREEDAIPQHGCVRQQAFTAIACSTALTSCQDNFIDLFENKNIRWYLNGLCSNLFYLDATVHPLFHWRQRKEVNEPTEDIIKCLTVLGEKDFNEVIEKMMKAQANNMKLLDARLIEVVQTFPAIHPASDYYRKLRVEITGLYNTLEVDAPDISKWLEKIIKNLENAPPLKAVVPLERPLVQMLADEYSGMLNINSKADVLERPIRVRECTASPEMQALCNQLLKRIFCKKAYCGVQLEFASSDVLSVVLEVRKILETEPILIEDVPADTYVVADLHGQFNDLFRYLKTVNSPEEIPGYKGGRRFVFMGDYVDRGKQSVEVMMTLFCLKILYPDKFILLRGNHEDFDQCHRNGFFKELLERFGMKNGVKLYKQFIITFSYLSFAAIVGDKYFCVHAGPSTRPVNKFFFRKIWKPIYDCGDITPLHDMVWGDPAHGLEGTCYNNHRHSSVFYSESTLDFFLKAMGCKAMIRGHQIMTFGSEISWKRLLCLFSSVEDKKSNLAAIVHVTADAEPITLRSLPNKKRLKMRPVTDQDAAAEFAKELDKDRAGDGDGQVAKIQG